MNTKDILKVFDEVLNQFENKCLSLARIGEKLSDLGDYNTHFQMLRDEGLLNPLEETDYTEKQERLDSINRFLDSNPDHPDAWRYEHERDDLEHELFQYGRRLIEGYETSLPVNIEDYQYNYQQDAQISIDSSRIDTVIGFHEQSAIDNQKETVKVNPDDISMRTVEYTLGGEKRSQEVPYMNDKRLISMNNYFNGDCDYINYQISHKGYINRLDSETRKHMKNIDSLMNESPGLEYPTILYRGGAFDIHTRVGDTISFKGYTSTTFQSSVADWYNEDKTGAMKYVIYAPSGTKGIVGNDDRFENGFMEHEYVLPRNTKMKVISIDYDTMTCNVMITNE